MMISHFGDRYHAYAEKTESVIPKFIRSRTDEL
jgi:protein-S-isoprenylcysteine O-methyltransferase Ste14